MVGKDLLWALVRLGAGSGKGGAGEGDGKGPVWCPSQGAMGGLLDGSGHEQGGCPLVFESGMTVIIGHANADG